MSLYTDEQKKALLKALNERFRFTKDGEVIPKNEDSYDPIILDKYMENDEVFEKKDDR